MARANQQLYALRQIGLALESTMSFDEVLSMAVQRTTTLMGAQRTTLFLLDDNDKLVSRVMEGGEISEISLDLGQGLAGWVARHGRPIIVEDVYKDDRFDPGWDEKSGFRTKDVLCHPMLGRHGAVIGVAEVLNKVGGKFVSDDLETLGLLCGQLAMTVENSRMMLDLVAKNRAITLAKIDVERRNKELSLLLDLERMVARSDDLEALFSGVFKRIMEISDSQVGVFYHDDDGGAETKVYTAAGAIQVLRVESGAGFAGWVASKGEELNLVAPMGDPRFEVNLRRRIGIPLFNMAAVPLPFSRDERIRGSLLIANKNRGDGFTEDDMMLLRLVAVPLAAAVDHLTGRVAKERERRLATVGRLLAGVLHDLKSPITVISGYAELMASKVAGEDGQEYLSHISRALDQIQSMAAEIIAFSKGDRDLLVRDTSISDLVDVYCEQLGRFLETHNIELKVHKRASGLLKVDQAKMIRAFQNITMNAVEVMPSGGQLVLEADRMGNDVIFSFTDSGPGIPEEIQGTVFQSFVTMGKEAGTGLGLALVREIIEGHGGKVSFSTSHGGGTTFLLSIPG